MLLCEHTTSTDALHADQRPPTAGLSAFRPMPFAAAVCPARGRVRANTRTAERRCGTSVAWMGVQKIAETLYHEGSLSSVEAVSKEVRGRPSTRIRCRQRRSK